MLIELGQKDLEKQGASNCETEKLNIYSAIDVATKCRHDRMQQDLSS